MSEVLDFGRIKQYANFAGKQGSDILKMVEISLDNMDANYCDALLELTDYYEENPNISFEDLFGIKEDLVYNMIHTLLVRLLAPLVYLEESEQKQFMSETKTNYINVFNEALINSKKIENNEESE